jgi:hypothetical protein
MFGFHKTAWNLPENNFTSLFSGVFGLVTVGFPTASDFLSNLLVSKKRMFVRQKRKAENLRFAISHANIMSRSCLIESWMG